MQEKQARYRSTQNNIVRINGAVSAHATVRSEHLLALTRENDALMCVVEMEDSIYDFHTKGTEQVAALVRATDTIKKRLVYQLDDTGTPLRLLNIGEIQRKWEVFRGRMSEGSLSWEMSGENLARLIEAGDAEYNSEEIVLKNSISSMFSNVTLCQYLTRGPSDFETEFFSTQSHFFPQVVVDVHCKTELRDETRDTLRLSKMGKPLSVDRAKMIALYEEMYRKQIEYRFTDYSYDISIDLCISKSDGLINTAEARIGEKIKNNMESEVLYEMRRVEL